MQQDSIRAVQWHNHSLRLLDQRRLPQEEIYLELKTASETAQAIKDMVVRGAPAIGITAAYGVVLAAIQHYETNPANWKQSIESDLTILHNARPTAINLGWAIQRMRNSIESLSGEDPINQLIAQAKAIHEEDIAANHRIGELGAGLIEQACDVITHCNTGSLATGGYGTALGVIRTGVAMAKINTVYADETRPWLQGSRLTAWELVQDQIPVTLIADSAAAHVMRTGKIGWVIVGSDRITANGDVANKIGTYSLAVNARYHGIKFMVVAPSSTVDMQLKSGHDIPIEYRNADEILSFSGKSITPQGVKALNPAFDVTPAELVDAIVTEKGVVLAPNQEKMAAMMKNAA